MNTNANTSAASAKRRGGAPLGNQNARKHGFYAKHLLPQEVRKLAVASRVQGLEQEIALMRVKLAQLAAQPDAPPDLFFRASRAIARLLLAQQQGMSPKQRREAREGLFPPENKSSL